MLPLLEHVSGEVVHSALGRVGERHIQVFGLDLDRRQTLAAFELEENEAARGDFDTFLASNPSHFLAPQARRKLAEMDERAGNLDQACEAYRQLTQQASAVLPEELSLLDLARCLAAKGEREESGATYQRILDDFPGSVYVTEARNSLLKLEEG